MKKFSFIITLAIIFCISVTAFSTPVIYINQIGFDTKSPKIAVIGVDNKVPGKFFFNIINELSGKTEFTSIAGKPETIDEWVPGKIFYQADFSSFEKTGSYKLHIVVNGITYNSYNFIIEENALAKLTIESIIHYYNKQRANTPQELEADRKMLLYGSTKTVDVHGGWCDASGDVSKYFSSTGDDDFRGG